MRPKKSPKKGPEMKFKPEIEKCGETEIERGEDLIAFQLFHFEKKILFGSRFSIFLSKSFETNSSIIEQKS